MHELGHNLTPVLLQEVYYATRRKWRSAAADIVAAVRKAVVPSAQRGEAGDEHCLG